MKVSVDPSRCEAHGMCEATAPEFFTLDDQGYSSIGTGKPVPPGQEDRVRLGVQSCPVAALSIGDDGAPLSEPDSWPKLPVSDGKRR